MQVDKLWRVRPGVFMAALRIFSTSADGGVGCVFMADSCIMTEIGLFIKSARGILNVMPIPRTDRATLERAVNEFYESHGASFSATRHSAWGVMRLVLEAAAHAETVIDVGAGNARLASIVPSHIAYISIEPSSSLREASREVIANRMNAQVRAGGFPDLPAIDGEADVVACLAVLHHVVSPAERKKAVHELARITRPGGKAIVTVWNLRHRSFFRLGIILAAWLRLPMIRGGGSGDVWIPWKAEGVKALRYVHAFTLREFKKLFDEREWKIERAEGWGADGPADIFSAKNLVIVAERKSPS